MCVINLEAFARMLAFAMERVESVLAENSKQSVHCAEIPQDLAMLVVSAMVQVTFVQQVRNVQAVLFAIQHRHLARLMALAMVIQQLVARRELDLG